MKWYSFLKEYRMMLFGYLFLLCFFLFLFQLFHVPFFFLCVFFFSFFFYAFFSVLFISWKKKLFYQQLYRMMDGLSKKYFITEMDLNPNFLEANILFDILLEVNRSMQEEVSSLKQVTEDFREYIEMWIHEVKIPLSNLILLVHNKEQDEGKMKEQLIRLDSYVEQVLFLVRSEMVEKDYLIHLCSLKEMVHEVVKRNKDAFILQHIVLSIDVEHSVYTDEKWMIFILNQILSNSLKYRKESNAKIWIKSVETKNHIYFTIKDNGVGISSSDLPRVFDKSFTGANGRELSSSTGMGLYIVKKLIDKLGHQITIESVVSEYTLVTITFSKTDFYQVIE